VVFGATGKQGGAIIDTLQKDNKYHIRGVSRTTHQERASKLREKGVEMIEADICSGQGLDNAFKDVYAAFLVTNSFEKGIEGNEYECGKKLVDKARQHGVMVLVWSSSPNAHELSKGKYDVPQFTEKAKVESYIKELQSKTNAFQSVVSITPTFYYQNFWQKGFAPKKDEKGTWVFNFPCLKDLVGFDYNDMGPIFQKIICDPACFNYKNILLDTEHGSVEDYIHTFEKVTKQPAAYHPIKPEELEQCPELNHGKQLCQMFQFLNEFPYPLFENTVQGKNMFPEMKSFEQWLGQSGWKGEVHP